MTEILQKIEPYVKWIKSYQVKCRFKLPGGLEINFIKSPETDGQLFYRFAISHEGMLQGLLYFHVLYNRLEQIDADFQQTNAEACIEVLDQNESIPDTLKPLFLKLLYYVITDFAYFAFDKDYAAPMKKELEFFLIDVMTDGNPYLESVAGSYM